MRLDGTGLGKFGFQLFLHLSLVWDFTAGMQV